MDLGNFRSCVQKEITFSPGHLPPAAPSKTNSKVSSDKTILNLRGDSEDQKA